MKVIIRRYMAFAFAVLLFHSALLVDVGSDALGQSRKIAAAKRLTDTTGAAARTEATVRNSPAARSSGEDVKNAETDAPSLASERSLLTAVHLLSTATYTRVALDLSKEAKYQMSRLKEDSAKGLPPRVFIDIAGARLALKSNDAIAVDDGVLRQVRVGQYSEEVVRVVLDMNEARDYKSFTLRDPYRLVIDIKNPKSGETSSAAATRKVAVPAAKAKAPAAQPVTGIRKIVLDPGHGGKDPGAIGVGGIAEKDVVLAIAKKLAVKLKKEMAIDVVLTRTDDRYVALEDRTAIANSEEADLFISLHMNASHNAESRGLETYYLDNTTDEASIRLAARENSTSRKNISDLQFILSDMTQNMKLEDSITLAHRLQGSLVDGMSRKMPEVKDLGVKKALFYVLVGARMPSVLVEMFFITNKSEGRAMSQDSYQDAMADALLRGIREYHQGTMAIKTL